MYRAPTPEDQALRIARKAVFDGRRIPAAIEAVLEARGIDVPAFERRLIESERFRR
jgi:hypothetical protein